MLAALLGVAVPRILVLTEAQRKDERNTQGKREACWPSQPGAPILGVYNMLLGTGKNEALPWRS